jgi:hypothetical protein
MAEIEPGTTSQGVPTETVVRESSAAAPPPAVGAPPPGAPARPRGLVRWGVALLSVAVVVGVVSVGAAFLAAGAGGSAVRGWLPPDTIAYLELRADLPGDQRAKVGDILAKFPGFADQASLDAKIDEALDRILEGSGSSWTEDVKPWLAGEVAVAVTSAALDIAKMPDLGALDPDNPDLGMAPDDGAVALVAVKDEAAAETWISGLIEGEQRTEPYPGGEITLVEGPLGSTMAYAIEGGVMILGPELTVKAALDTGGDSKVASSDSFAAALETAPNAYLGFGYLDVAAFVDAATEAAGSAADLPQACLDDALAAIPAWASGSMRADTDVLVFTTTAPAVGDPPATEASASAIAAHLPGSTVVAIEIRDFGPSLLAGIDMIKEQLACEPSAAEMVDQVEQALAAIGGAEALVGWADDTAIAVEFTAGTPGGGLAATVSDEAAAERALDQIQALLALGGAGSGLAVREEAYGDGTLLVVEIPSELAGEELPAIAATAQGGIFALGTLDFVKHVVDTEAGDSLASSDRYERAIAAAGGDGVSDVYVDISGLVAAAETMIPAEEKSRYETEVKPFLEPFEAFAAVSEATGTSSVSRAVITFTK